MHAIACFILLLASPVVFASGSSGATENLDMTTSLAGLLALGIFVAAYSLVMAEEFIHLRKSKPVILAAGLIWVIVAVLIGQSDLPTDTLELNIQHNLSE